MEIHDHFKNSRTTYNSVGKAVVFWEQ